jgi:hypothetical protein
LTTQPLQQHRCPKFEIGFFEDVAPRSGLGQIVRLERMAHERSATIDFDKRLWGQSFNGRPADAVLFARCCRRFFYYLL